MNLSYCEMYGDGFCRRWFWRMVYALWMRLLDRFGHDTLTERGFVREDLRDRQTRKADDARILSALMFVLEALQESPELRISGRATYHLPLIAMERLHRCHIDWVRELPTPKLELPAEASVND